MLLVEYIISLYAPHICIECGNESNALLCGHCSSTVPRVPSRCYRCKAVSRDYETCKRCHAQTPLRKVWVTAPYESIAREVVHRTKYERAQAGAQTMARLTSPLLTGVADDVLLVPVPTASRRVRQRGYDQAVLFARELGELTGLKTARLLARQGQAHQVGAGRTDRLRHLQGAFRVTHPGNIEGKRVILVDDVLTTGATLETAAREFRRAGAKSIDAIVFAQA